jgi:hypothetical protein
MHNYPVFRMDLQSLCKKAVVLDHVSSFWSCLCPNQLCDLGSLHILVYKGGSQLCTHTLLASPDLACSLRLIHLLSKRCAAALSLRPESKLG